MSKWWRRFKEWLMRRLESCPKCGAGPENTVIYWDGHLHCTACGYRSYKDKR